MTDHDQSHPDASGNTAMRERAYFLKRAADHRICAEIATEDRVRAIHAKLQELYESRAASIR